MRKIIILTSFLIIAIAAMAIKYFSSISTHSSNVEVALKNVPQDAALILNFSNDDSFYEIFKDYELFDAVIGEERASEIKQLQQTLLRQPDLKDVTSEKNIFISFHPNAADSVDFLYTINLNPNIDLSDIEEALFTNPELSAGKNNINGVFSIKLKSLNKLFYLSFQNGAATGSFSQDLLLRSISADKPKVDEALIKEISNSGAQNNNSPVNIYINHSQIPGFISKYIHGKVNGPLGILTHIKGFSSLNMNFKSDALMFNGISKTDKADLSYASLYLSQKPVKNDLKNVFPENIAYFISFGISDFNTFSSNLQKLFNKRKELPRLQSQLNAVKTRRGVDLDKELKPYFGNEFAILESSLREKFAIIKLKNGRQADFTLQMISSRATTGVSQFNNSNILYYFFGDPLKQFARPYFTVIDNYLIVANASSLVQKLVANFGLEHSLIKSPDFADYNQYVANQSNIFYFINNKNAERLIASSLKANYAKAFKDDSYGLKNFYGFSYQWSADDGYFFTNIYINYKSAGSYKLKEAWNNDLGARPASQPQLLDYKGSGLILVQDRSDNLHAISVTGKKLWTVQVKGKIQGEFQKPGAEEIIFCTNNNLYRMNLNGTVAEGYPTNLPFNATYGPALLNDKIYIPAGNNIMAFTKDGTSLPNWNHTLNGKILFGLNTINVGDMRAVMAGTENGLFYIYDESGDLLVKAQDESTTLYKSPVFLDSDNSPESSRLITADTSGSITFVTLKGLLTKKKLPEVHSPQSFSFVNITGDEYPEYVFLDKKGVNLISKDNLPAWSYNFSSEGKRKFVSYKINNFVSQAGILDTDKREFYLFKDDGSLLKGFPVEVGDYAIVTSPGNDNTRYLITNKGSMLTAYKL